ncbi:PhzF family phenazine biosynthesis protein [Actinoplanes aureus]|uniref:PhzF family phenazine biosynthesis protein n=1 Tax=Actinoplanes aureus TaxID=2792083 RepID=A0A931CBN2_9ACTN|nr:PhzF family phenazine biosynthesis protein [Actinoplanes aureus]MBG0564427.1 PhzF family phenazine biosynthesis protein [Actinoplanes aureus]
MTRGGHTIVAACTRDGAGGSPTAVVVDPGTQSDDERRAIVRAAGTSHAAFVDTGPGDVPTVRFFTTAGELRNCGHGTIAAQAVLLERGGAGDRLRTGGRTFATTAVRRPEGIEVWFDQGVIALREQAATDHLFAALGLGPDDVAGDDTRVASPGTPRLLVPVRDQRKLRALRPDFELLAAACRRLGYLGCFAYTLTPGQVAVGRMFAPAIGVDEDVVNANSAGCLAAHLLDSRGDGRIEVHQGDTLGRASTVFATAERTADGVTAWIGGLTTVPAPGVPGATPASGSRMTSRLSAWPTAADRP